jgi:hypothetical protein
MASSTELMCENWQLLKRKLSISTTDTKRKSHSRKTQILVLQDLQDLHPATFLVHQALLVSMEILVFKAMLARKVHLDSQVVP